MNKIKVLERTRLAFLHVGLDFRDVMEAFIEVGQAGILADGGFAGDVDSFPDGAVQEDLVQKKCHTDIGVSPLKEKSGIFKTKEQLFSFQQK